MTVRRPRTVFSRVLASYGLVTLSFAAVAGYAVWGQHRSARALESTRSGYMPLALALRDAVASQNTYNSQLNYITEAKNPADKEAWFGTTLAVGRPRVFAHIRVALQRAFADDSGSLGQELSLELDDIERYLAADEDALAQLFDTLRSTDTEGAEALRDELVTRGTQSLIRLRNLEERVNLSLDFLMADALQHEQASLRILLVWAVFTVLFGALVALYVRRLLRPLVAVTKRANAVAQGDFTPHAIVARDDEIGELARTFESMVEAISRANRELVEAERLATIGKMAAQVTHEVRNPLSSIGLNLEMLEEELAVATPDAQELCVAIRREVERLTELTEQYLSVARRSDPDLQQEDFSTIVEESLAFIRPELERHGVRLVCSMSPSPLEVRVDEGQMRQVIHNLVRNARQAMPGGGTIVVRTLADNGKAVLAVEDEGPGVSPAARAHLFEPFFSTKNRGTGLGLAVSRQIVETHGGTLECASREPHGALFEVRLPLEAPAATLSADT